MFIEQYKLDSFARFHHKLAANCTYVGGPRDPAHLTCPNGHQFSVSWQGWNKGVRCKECKRQQLLPCRVYYLEFEPDPEPCFKIGITTRSIDARWGSGIHELKQTILCRSESIARKVESRVKGEFALLTRPGSKEFFSQDVLQGRLLESFADDGDILPESDAIVPIWSSCFGVVGMSREKVASDRRRQDFYRILGVNISLG